MAKQATMDGMERGNAKLDEMIERYKQLDADKKALKLEIIAYMARTKRPEYHHGQIHAVRTTGKEGLRCSIDAAPSEDEE